MKKQHILILIISFLSLWGCQSQQQKPDTDATLKAEALAMGWTQLQQSTINHLREKSYGEAEINIKQMMAFAGADNDKWEYIRMALVSMPTDMATELVDRALNKPFINDNNDQKFAFIRLLTQIKQENKALDMLNGLIKANKTPEYVYWRARLNLMLEKEPAAEKDYQWLLKQDAKNVEYLTQYTTLLNFLGRNEEAMQILQANEHDVDLLFRQVILLLQKTDETAAKEKFVALKELVQQAELEAEQLLEIGELAYWLADYDYSIQLLEQVKTGEHINKAKLIMANVLVKQAAFDRAAVMYHQVQNGPEEHAIPAYLLEIQLYREQNNIAEAMEVADMGLRMFKDDIDLLYSRAMLHGQLNDINALEKDLQRILQQDPTNPDAMNALGYTWADNDMNLQQAYDYIMQAHAQKPKDKAILDSVGWVYYKKGDLDKAEKYLRMAVENNTRDTESFEHLIIVLEAQGKQTEANKFKAKAKEIFSDFEM